MSKKHINQTSSPEDILFYPLKVFSTRDLDGRIFPGRDCTACKTFPRQLFICQGSFSRAEISLCLKLSWAKIFVCRILYPSRDFLSPGYFSQAEIALLSKLFKTDIHILFKHLHNVHIVALPDFCDNSVMRVGEVKFFFRSLL